MKYVAHPAEVDQMVLNILILIKKYIYYQQNKSKITKKNYCKETQVQEYTYRPQFSGKGDGTHREKRLGTPETGSDPVFLLKAVGSNNPCTVVYVPEYFPRISIYKDFKAVTHPCP